MYSVLADDWTLEQLLDCMVVALLIFHLHLNHTIDHEDKLITSLLGFLDEGTFLEYLLLHEELDFVEELLLFFLIIFFLFIFLI